MSLPDRTANDPATAPDERGPSGGEPGFGCNCIDLTNTALAEHNTRLVLAFTWNESGKTTTRIGVPTQIIEKKRGVRPINILATFCPFCGVRYEPEEAIASARPMPREEGS